MVRIVRISFAYDGSYDQFEPILPAFAEKARSVPGLVWKIWTYDDDAHRGAGLYLFSGESEARAYLEWIVPQMRTLAKDVSAELLRVHEGATRATRGPIDVPAASVAA
jgi:hypothetical protein